MKRIRLWLMLMVCAWSVNGFAQDVARDILNEGQQLDEFGNPVQDDKKGQKTWGRDTSKVDQTVPTEFHQWHIDERLGTVLPEAYNDTLPHLFQNFNSTDGYYGEYNYTGNLGAPRLSRLFLDREMASDFMFLQPYDYFHTTPSSILFTNTKSPLTNLQYHSCGTRERG